MLLYEDDIIIIFLYFISLFPTQNDFTFHYKCKSAFPGSWWFIPHPDKLVEYALSKVLVDQY